MTEPYRLPLLHGAFELPLNDGHYTAIGRAAAHWSSVENCVFGLLRRLLQNYSEEWRPWIASQRSETQVQLIRVLVDTPALRSREYRAEIVAILARVEELRTKRNDVVHALWSEGINAEAPFANKPKAKGLKQSRRPYTAREIGAIANEIWDLWCIFLDFLIRYDMGL